MQNAFGIGKDYEFAKYPSKEAYTGLSDLPEYVSAKLAHKDRKAGAEDFMFEIWVQPLESENDGKGKSGVFFTDTKGVLKENGVKINETIQKLGFSLNFSEGQSFKTMWSEMKSTVADKVEELKLKHKVDLSAEKQRYKREIHDRGLDLFSISAKAESIQKELEYLNKYESFIKITDYKHESE